MTAALALSQALRAQIQDEARAAFPRECCGLIEGRRDGDAIRAITLHPARNLSTDADRFEIDPADHFRALRTARANGHEIIGCYHSHPNGVADISERDREGATDDGFVWLICSITAKDARISGFIRENGLIAVLDLHEIPAA
jgi:proteasome lid subunit RPN8/RPN11